jgi:hypothetical protein
VPNYSFQPSQTNPHHPHKGNLLLPQIPKKKIMAKFSITTHPTMLPYIIRNNMAQIKQAVPTKNKKALIRIRL